MQMEKPVHPGEVLKELYLEPLQLTLALAAKGLGISRKALSELVNGNVGISTQMALRLGKAFGTTPELWLNMQQNYDLRLARDKTSLSKVQVLFHQKASMH